MEFYKKNSSKVMKLSYLLAAISIGSVFNSSLKANQIAKSLLEYYLEILD